MRPSMLRVNFAAVLIRAMLGLIRRVRGHRPAATGSIKSQIVIMNDPATQYKPSNPKWLIEGVAWTPDSIPADLLIVPPPMKEFRAAVAAGKLQHLELGSSECKELFCLDPDFTYLNHGSYGAAYKLALDVQTWYRQQLEREPVKFMETAGLAALVTAVVDVAGFVGADWRDVVPVTNATTGVNAVLQSLKLQKGDLILMTNVTYAAVRSAVAHTAAAAGAGLMELNLELSDLQDEEKLVAAFEAAIAASHGRLRLAVLDLILSFPPVILPVQRLCKLFSAAGVPVLVDGAHSVGSLYDLKVPELGCSYFVSTLHKWLCTPKGAAMLWVHPSKQDSVHPCVVSHGYELGMRAEFLWQGTADFTAWLAASACLELQRALQPQRITTYNHDLARRATAMLLSAWGTSTALGIATDGSTAGLVAIELPWPLQIPPRSSSSNSTAEASTAVRVAVNRVQPSSSTVSVPDDAKGSDGKGSSERGPTPADAAALNLLLREQYSIEVPVACVSGLLFTRISAQIYNTMADYGRLRDVICGLRSSATLRHMPS